jgi:hypothetical protein
MTISSRTEAIKGAKKIKKFIKLNKVPRPLRHNVHIAHTTNRILEKTFLPISPSVFSSQSGGSMKQPGMSFLPSKFLIWKIKKSPPVLYQESRVDGITRGSLVSPKIRRKLPKIAPVHCRAEDTRTHFPEIQA